MITDGSGIEYWFDKVLNKKVPRHVLPDPTV